MHVLIPGLLQYQPHLLDPLGLLSLVISPSSHFAPRNVIYEACLFWFMAKRTRNITFEAR